MWYQRNYDVRLIPPLLSMHHTAWMMLRHEERRIEFENFCKHVHKIFYGEREHSYPSRGNLMILWIRLMGSWKGEDVYIGRPDDWKLRCYKPKPGERRHYLLVRGRTWYNQKTNTVLQFLEPLPIYIHHQMIGIEDSKPVELKKLYLY